VNTLTKRLRKDLARGGINGAALVKRSRGQTRFRLAKNTRVRVLAPR
jgi:hypothetical protein